MKSHDIANAAKKRAIAMLKEGTLPAQVLYHIATAAESITPPGSAASILVLDEHGLLRNGASPQMPADYLEAIDGLKPDANLGTCAAAAATGKVVITKSFHEDSKWAELRHLPLALGYQGAWSTPIKAKGGAVLGTLGIYNRDLRVPSQEERDAMLTLASAAADALEKSKSPRQPAFAR